MFMSLLIQCKPKKVGSGDGNGSISSIEKKFIQLISNITKFYLFIQLTYTNSKF